MAAVFVRAMKSQLLPAEGVKPSLGLARALASRAQAQGAEESGHAEVSGCPLSSIASRAEIRAKGSREVSSI